MGFSGNIGELDKIAINIGRGLQMGKISRRAKDAIVRQVSADVAAERDPYGKPWPARVDGKPLATDLTLYLRAKSTPDAITLNTIGPQGNFRTGTSKMVQRPLLPNEEQGTPPTWTTAIDDAVSEAIAVAK